MKKLKSNILEIFGIFGVCIFQLKLRRILKKSVNPANEYVYIWIPPRLNENLGDLGMTTVIEDYYKNDKVVYLSNNISIHGFETKQKKLFFNYEQRSKELFESLKTHPPRILIIVGADTLDGAYGSVEPIFKLATAWNFQRSSVQTRLINLSWNGQKINYALKLILDRANSSGAKFFARDGVSLSRLQILGVNPVLTADLVFNLQPKTNVYLQNDFKIWKSINSSIVGIGFGEPLDKEVNYFEKMVGVCRSLLSESYSILLSPSGSSESDIELNQKLFRVLNSEDVFLYQDFSSNFEFIEVISTAKFGISNRMHFIIHALLVNVPVIGVEYQGKFEGLYRILEMSHFNIQSISEVDSAANLMARELHLCKGKVIKALPKLTELSRNNFC